MGESLSATTKQTFAEVVRIALTEPLKTAGYRKSGLRWRQRSDHDEVHRIVEIRRHASGLDEITFIVEWGIHVPGFPPPEFGPRKSPTVSSSLVNGRMGDLATPPQHNFWIIAGKTAADHTTFAPVDLTDLMLSLRELLTGRLLPLLESFQRRSDMVSFFEKRPSWYKPAVVYPFDDLDMAKRLVREAS